MLEHIRIATPEEVEDVREASDLTNASSVWAFEKIRAVVRQCTEMDPVFFNDATDQKKVLFMWGAENMLRAMGVQEYYCNVVVDESTERWRETLQKLNFTQISKAPELRFKKAL